MPIEITMPALSPTMEKGNLAKWLVREGDAIAAGDVIAEIETDKATMEVEAADAGTVGRLFVAEGAADVPVGTVIAVLLEEGEEAAALSAPKPAPRQQVPAGKQESAADGVKPDEVKPGEGKPDEVRPDDTGPDAGRIIASPLARRLARQAGIDLGAVRGSGPGGRVVKRDLEGAAPLAKAVPAGAATGLAPMDSPAPTDIPAPLDIPYEEVRLSGMRRVIAARLSESKRTIPHFYLTVDVTLDRLLALRAELNEGAALKLSVNDFIIKALARALVMVPDANVQFAGDKLLKFHRADVAVAVAIEGGLVTPVIRDAALKGLAAIASEMQTLAGKARAGKLLPEDYQGGTVSLSNLGMFGIKQFEAVINPPQAAILAVGAGEARAVVRDGAVVVATVMSATLSCDHRAIDGATGAVFLNAFKTLMENPLKMLT